MATPTSPKPKSVATADTALTARWGAEVLSHGFTGFPDVIFKYQKALKLKPLDVLILLHLASYWREKSNFPWPAKATIAEAIGVDPRTVQRAIKGMEELGYVKRILRKADVGDNLTNKYDMRGLVVALTKLSLELTAERDKREATEKARRTTPTTLALVSKVK